MNLKKSELLIQDLNILDFIFNLKFMKYIISDRTIESITNSEKDPDSSKNFNISFMNTDLESEFLEYMKGYCDLETIDDLYEVISPMEVICHGNGGMLHFVNIDYSDVDFGYFIARLSSYLEMKQNEIKIIII